MPAFILLFCYYYATIILTNIIALVIKHGTLQESTEEECQIQINIPKSLSPKSFRKTSKENLNPSDSKKNPDVRNERPPDFDGGCWEMLNQDAIQILPPRPKIPTKPTTSCIKPTFKEREKKGKSIRLFIMTDSTAYYAPFGYNLTKLEFLKRLIL